MNRNANSARWPKRSVFGHRDAQEQKGRSVIRIAVDWIVFVFVCIGLWFFVGPAQFGGPSHYVIVDGPSMEPTYRDGDLVITRAQESYGVGDVVTYQPDTLGQYFPVIHRIVDVTPEGHFVTQGDNRAQVDGWLATGENILGSSWVHVPYGGVILLFVRKPILWLALAAGFLAMGLLSRGETQERSGAMRPRKADQLEGVASRISTMSILLVLPLLFAMGGFAAYLFVNAGVLQAWSIEVSAPVAEAGADSDVGLGAAALVTLDGSGSTGDEPLAYAWTLEPPGGSGAVLDDPASAITTFTADIAGEYVATLVVTDASGLAASDFVTITVTTP